MGQISLFFQPPLHWQQFEDLTRSVFEKIHVVQANKNGRSGQAQQGVDIYGSTKQFGNIGIQCKRVDELDANNQPIPGGSVTRTFLRAEAEKALAFSPALDIWILATTAKRDGSIQQVARKLSEEYQRKQKFEIQLWSWDDYITWLNTYTDLQKWYYEKVIHIYSDLDQDRFTLETIAMAFHRPAFTDPLAHEHVDDFLQALKDTQSALRTGELVNRDTRHVIRKSVGGWRLLKEPHWKNRLNDLDRELQELRKQLMAGLNDGRLQQHRHYLQVNDAALGQDLDRRRRLCLGYLNDVLVNAELSPV